MSSMLDRLMEEHDEQDRLTVLPVTEKEVALAVKWMSERLRKKSGNAMLAFPADWMPETGLAVYECCRLLCVASLYLEKSSPVAVCGWCISNPQNTVTVSDRAIRAVMTAMPDYAKANGAKHLLTTFGNRGINRILDTLGYINGETSQNKYKLL